MSVSKTTRWLSKWTSADVGSLRFDSILRDRRARLSSWETMTDGWPFRPGLRLHSASIRAMHRRISGRLEGEFFARAIGRKLGIRTAVVREMIAGNPSAWAHAANTR
jgi:hypothetical protein